MRLWSILTKYLDRMGLLALWREALLAKNVLEGRTKGYRNHPQLVRFKAFTNQVSAINRYLEYVWIEANSRGYSFDSSKFIRIEDGIQIPVTSGQIDYEFKHLLRKLKVRDIDRYNLYKDTQEIDVMPLFNVVNGGIEKWERV